MKKLWLTFLIFLISTSVMATTLSAPKTDAADEVVYYGNHEKSQEITQGIDINQKLIPYTDLESVGAFFVIKGSDIVLIFENENGEIKEHTIAQGVDVVWGPRVFNQNLSLQFFEQSTDSNPYAVCEGIVFGIKDLNHHFKLGCFQTGGDDFSKLLSKENLGLNTDYFIVDVAGMNQLEINDFVLNKNFIPTKYKQSPPQTEPYQMIGLAYTDLNNELHYALINGQKIIADVEVAPHFLRDPSSDYSGFTQTGLGSKNFDFEWNRFNQMGAYSHLALSDDGSVLMAVLNGQMQVIHSLSAYQHALTNINGGEFKHIQILDAVENNHFISYTVFAEYSKGSSSFITAVEMRDPNDFGISHCDLYQIKTGLMPHVRQVYDETQFPNLVAIKYFGGFDLKGAPFVFEYAPTQCVETSVYPIEDAVKNFVEARQIDCFGTNVTQFKAQYKSDEPYNVLYKRTTGQVFRRHDANVTDEFLASCEILEQVNTEEACSGEDLFQALTLEQVLEASEKGETMVEIDGHEVRVILTEDGEYMVDPETLNISNLCSAHVDGGGEFKGSNCSLNSSSNSTKFKFEWMMIFFTLGFVGLIKNKSKLHR